MSRLTVSHYLEGRYDNSYVYQLLTRKIYITILMRYILSKMSTNGLYGIRMVLVYGVQK